MYSPLGCRTSVATRSSRTIADRCTRLTSSDSYGADLNGSVRVGAFSGMGGVSAYRQATDGRTAGGAFGDVSNAGAGFSARGVVDPFNTMRTGSVTSDGQVLQTSERVYRARGVFAGFTYALGQSSRLRPRTPEPADAGAPDGAPR